MNRQIRIGLMICCLTSVLHAAEAQTDTTQTFASQPDTSIQLQTPVTPVSAFARPATIRPKRPAPIANEWSAGLRLNTDGWSLFFDRGKSLYEDAKTSDKFYNVKLYQIEFQEHKHPKEQKENHANQALSDQEKTKPYILGKINNFYALKLGYGMRKMIAGKPEPGTVSIHWVYAGGISIGLLKPYYVDAIVPATPSGGAPIKKAIKYNDGYENAFIDKNVVIGSSGWTQGLGETKVVPGIHGRSGLHFDFGSHAKSKLAIETGIAAELYTKKIELMARQKAFPYLVSGYISVQFGKRW